VAPPAIGILTIEVVVLPTVHNQRDFAHFPRTLFVKRGFLDGRNVSHHQILHDITPATLDIVETLCKTLGGAWLMV
jgi:hypothetical protein